MVKFVFSHTPGHTHHHTHILGLYTSKVQLKQLPQPYTQFIYVHNTSSTLLLASIQYFIEYISYICIIYLRITSLQTTCWLGYMCIDGGNAGVKLMVKMSDISQRQREGEKDGAT